MASNFIRAGLIILTLTGITLVYYSDFDISDSIKPSKDEDETSKDTISQISKTTDTPTSSNSNSETPTSTVIPPVNKNYTLLLVEVFDAGSASPVGVRHANDGSHRLFLIDQKGKIYVLKNETGYTESSVFLDISNLVNYGGEMGLLGLAFHPNYSDNGYFYVNYVSDTPNLHTVVSRFTVDPSNHDIALSNSEHKIIEIDQPATNHNGGDIVFGKDGYLYIAMGDGGGGGDKYHNGQDRTTLLGAILRIDIDNNSTYGNYAIPQDNLFKDNVNGYKEEIFAWGMRNPWRMSVDSHTGTLWVGDVGQNRYEEVDIVVNGKNYGWPIMEGFHCYETNCDMTGLELPIQEYGRTDGTTVTGGYVYRGNNVLLISGLYMFADYGSGRIWSINSDDPTQASKLWFDTDINISSFGEDESGELYLTSLNGKIYVFEQVEI